MNLQNIRYNNYNMAIGRVGLAIVMVPLLWGFAFLLIFEGPGNLDLGTYRLLLGFLIVFGAAFLWIAHRVPWWIAIKEDRLWVRYSFGTRSFDIKDISRIKTGKMYSTIGPGSRSYQSVKIKLASGRSIQFLGGPQIVDAIRSRLPSVPVTSARLLF
jgi:hypothetical protein